MSNSNSKRTPKLFSTQQFLPDVTNKRGCTPSEQMTLVFASHVTNSNIARLYCLKIKRPKWRQRMLPVYYRRPNDSSLRCSILCNETRRSLFRLLLQFILFPSFRLVSLFSFLLSSSIDFSHLCVCFYLSIIFVCVSFDQSQFLRRLISR